MPNVDNAVAIVIITNIIVAVGAWVTARAEKPSAVFSTLIEELRKQNESLERDKNNLQARLDKLSIEREEDYRRMKTKLREKQDELERKAVYAGNLRRELRKYAPRTGYVMPEEEGNGTTPPESETK